MNIPVAITDPTGTEMPWLFTIRHHFIANKIGQVEDGSRKNIPSRASNFAINLGFKDAPGSGMGGERNAFRHVMWQAMITKEFGEDIAKKVGYGHEENPHAADRISGAAESGFNTSDLKAADDVCDLMNNRIGRWIGLCHKDDTVYGLAGAILEEFCNNGLWQVVKNEDGSYMPTRVKIDEWIFEEKQGLLQTLDCDGKQ